jgi:hypothetical protein
VYLLCVMALVADVLTAVGGSLMPAPPLPPPPAPVPAAPLPQGQSRVLTGEPTLHTRTACMVAEALTASKFSISHAEGRGPGLWTLECQGAAVAAP